MLGTAQPSASSRMAEPGSNARIAASNMPPELHRAMGPLPSRPAQQSSLPIAAPESILLGLLLAYSIILLGFSRHNLCARGCTIAFSIFGVPGTQNPYKSSKLLASWRFSANLVLADLGLVRVPRRTIRAKFQIQQPCLASHRRIVAFGKSA
jgi:hypothetical protein